MEKKLSSDFSGNKWYEEGRRLTKDGRYKEALAALNSAIDQNPRFAEAYFARGACHYALGRYLQAGEDLDAAAVLGCRDAQFWSRYAFYSHENNADDKEA